MVLAKKIKSFNLLQWFSIMSFASIAVISVISAILLSRFLSENMLRRDAVVTKEFVQTIAQSENAGAYFESESHEKGKTVFESFFKKISTMPEVVRVNIYARDGTVIWSDQERFIGHNFMPNRELIVALSGRLAIGSGTSGRPGKAEHVFDKEVPFFAEIYIPIRNAAGDRVVGAVEVYKVPLALFEAIKKGDLLVWTSALFGGIFLYASLFWIVRRAANVIRIQRSQLVKCEECETMLALGEMASAVAHSIRNPLASIRSSAEVALTGESLPSFQNAAKDIMSEVDRVENWIRNLLTYSQPLKNISLPVKINDVIKEALVSFNKEIERRGVKLILDLREPLPVIGGDFNLLGQVFNSLIANAIQAMPKEGKLTFYSRISEDQNQIEVKIIDTGHGIPKDQIEKVFRPFFTLKEKGLGVGLYLVRRIVERHCGTISLSSVEGQGTTFCLRFPVLK